MAFKQWCEPKEKWCEEVLFGGDTDLKCRDFELKGVLQVVDIINIG